MLINQRPDSNQESGKAGVHVMAGSTLKVQDDFRVDKDTDGDSETKKDDNSELRKS